MSRKPLEPSAAVLPPPNFYAWPLGMVAVALICYGGMWAYQHVNYTCVAFKAMCEERERLQQADDSRERAMTSVVPVRRWEATRALQMPPKPKIEWLTVEEGCPSHYKPMNGACWIGVEEPPPCPTSYLRDSKCWAPLARGQRPGVSDGALR